MAANLSVEIGLTGQAADQAKQITAAFKEMGAAGDTAVKSVQQLQQVASRPIGTGASSAQVTAQLVAGFERAKQVMQEMREQAEGMAGIGLGSEFAGVAAGAQEVQTALANAVDIFKQMVSEGRNVEEILAAMKEQALGLPEGFENLSAVEQRAFRQMQADIEGSIEKYRLFQNVSNQMARETQDAAKQFQEQEKAKQRELDATTNAIRRQEQEEQRQQNIRRQATQEMARSPFGGAVSSMTNIAMGAQMMGQGGFMGPIMGMQMLATGVNEASIGAATFGARFMALIPILAGVGAAVAGVAGAVKVMQESIKSAAEEQALEVRLRAITGSAQNTGIEMGAMKDFVTGSTGGAFALPDVAKGTAQLQNLIGPAAANRDILEGIAGSAVKAGISYQEMTAQVGALMAKMQEGAPIRETGLIELQKEGVLTAQDVEEITKEVKAHADVASAIKLVTERLHENAPAAAAMTATWKGLWQQLSNVVSTQIFAPIGQALIAAFSPAIKEITQQFGQLGDAITEGLRSGNFAPAIEQILSAALKDGWNTGVGLVTQALPTLEGAVEKTFTSLGTDLYNQLKKAFDDVVADVSDIDFWKRVGDAVGAAVENGVKNGIHNAIQNVEAWIKGLAQLFGTVTPSPWQPAGQVTGAPTSDWNKTLATVTTTGQLGGAGKAPKEAKDAWKELADEIKQASDYTKEAGMQVQLYDALTKAGMMSADQAAQAKDKAYAEEIVHLTDIIPLLQKQQQAAQAAMDAATPGSQAWEKDKEAVEKARDAVEQYSIKVIEAKAAQQQLGTGTPWQNLTQGIREATNAWGTFGQQTIQLGKTLTDDLASGLGNGLAQLVEGTGKVKDAFKSMLTSMIQAITDFLAKQAVQQLFNMFTSIGSSAAGGFAGTGSTSLATLSATGFQTGGLVRGPSGEDKVPSALTAGEYVLTPRAVDKYGLAMIEAMNRGMWMPGYAQAGVQKYASGGLVGSATSPANIPPSQNVNAPTNSQTIAIVTNVNVPPGSGTPPGLSTPGGTGGQGGLSPQDIAQFQQLLSNQIRDVIVRERRPGGLLSKQQFIGS